MNIAYCIQQVLPFFKISNHIFISIVSNILFYVFNKQNQIFKIVKNMGSAMELISVDKNLNNKHNHV